WPGGRAEVARAPKIEVARALIALIAKRLPPSDGTLRRGARKRRAAAATRTAGADSRIRLRSRRTRR
ncbi:MAG: hypothetical protein ACLQT5_06240, partial [Steroidobacteraceae bacterium]